MLKEQKSSGLTIRDWCRENNISTHCFYYRQQKLRERAGEVLTHFVEIQQPQAATHLENIENNSAAQISAGSIVIGLNNNASEELIGRIVRVLNAQ